MVRRARALTKEEYATFMRFTRPEAFTPTADELERINRMLAEGILRRYRDGSIGITAYGERCFYASLDEKEVRHEI